MAASWLLQAIYTSLLSSVSDLGGSTGGPSPSVSTTTSQAFTTVLANTTAGVVRGVVDESSQPTIFRYLGVPFAKPPIDDLRFQPPVNPEPWSGVRGAYNISPQCWQPYVSQVPSTIPNSEDCLYLNIYTPARNSSRGLLPVMVWIHGGGYFVGTASTYNGTELARQGGVVVVTINYRLGVFGFLSTEDSAMPGNYGLLDQIHALKWVRDNIASFGGDPNSVTIFGESAGSSSVSLLVLSPLAKGLFHRAIMESGVSLAHWAHVHPTNRLSPVYGARMLGAENGCGHVFGQSDSFVKCLRGISASSLIDSASYISKYFDTNIFIWLLPRVETDFGVLPDAPLQLLAQGKFNDVDTIRGFNSHENGEMKIRNNTVSVDSRNKFIELIQLLFRPYAFYGTDGLVQFITDSYLGNSSDPNFIERKATEASSDISFAAPTVVELKMVAAKSSSKKHYLYKFGYRDSFSTEPSWIGAIHGDELKHVFSLDGLDFDSLGYDKVTETLEDTAMTQRMMTMWSNFAKTGDPTSSKSSLTWAPFTSDKKWMMNIDTTASVTEFSRSNIVTIYDKVLQMFYRLGSSPSESVVG